MLATVKNLHLVGSICPNKRLVRNYACLRSIWADRVGACGSRLFGDVSHNKRFAKRQEDRPGLIGQGLIEGLSFQDTCGCLARVSGCVVGPGAAQKPVLI
jgi:hypothetical protein